MFMELSSSEKLSMGIDGPTIMTCVIVSDCSESFQQCVHCFCQLLRHHGNSETLHDHMACIGRSMMMMVIMDWQDVLYNDCLDFRHFP